MQNKIGMHAFFALATVVAQIDIEKSNAFGSEQHRNAHIVILGIADDHGVSEYFEALSDYDAMVVRTANLKFVG